MTGSTRRSQLGDEPRHERDVCERELEPIVAALLLPGVSTGYLASIAAAVALAVPLLVSDAPGTWAWLALRVTVSIVLYVACRRLRRRMDDPRHVLRRLEWIVAIGAVVWGLLPVMVRPDDIATEALVVAFACGNLFAVTATSSVRPAVYRAGVVPAAVIALAGVLMHGGPGTGAWVLLIVVASMYSYVVFRSMHSSLVARVQAEAAQAQLAHQRDLEREAAVLARDQLEVALRQRSVAAAELSVLVTALGHDLSTPLTSATLAADLLAAPPDGRTNGPGDGRRDGLRDGLDQDQQRLVEQIRSSIRHANVVVRDLRQRPSATARELEVTRRPMALADVVRSVVSELDRAGGGVEIVQLDDGAVGIGDRALVSRMLDNLVGNALVHARATRIEVSGRRCGDRVELVVTDDGVGVPEHLRHTLFDPHARGDESPGEGIGLFIVRTFARLQDGDVTHTPGDSGGSRFTITLPAGAEGERAADAQR